ncbi:MAG: PAS domain S-box protein [Pseudomonadota bacterium]
MNPTSNQPFSRLSNFYIIALSLIALLTIAGFFLIQWALYQQTNDAHLINIAGRQRMLSENLSKTALIIQLSTDTNQRLQYIEKFRQVLNFWQQSHNNIALSSNNSATVTQQFAELEPHYQAMKSAAQNLLAAAQHPHPINLSKFVQQIVTQQPAFVQQMDAIISQYEAEALNRMNQMKIIVFIIATLILIVLLLESIYLFRPKVAEIRKLNAELKQHVKQRTTQLEMTSQNLLLYKMAITETYEGITIADAIHPDMPLIYVNPAFERITGYTSAELIGRNSRFLHESDHKQPALNEVRAAIREGKNCHVVLRNYRKDGSPFWNQLNISPIHDAAGNLTHFVGIQLDITAQKEAEEALQASEERYRRIINTTQEGICVLDTEGRTTFINQRLHDMLGYNLEEMQGHFLFDSLDKAARIEAEQHFEQCKQGIKEQFDFRFRRKDGSQLWTLISANPFFDDNGEFMGALGMISDITERKQAEFARQNSLDLLQKVLSSLNEAVLIINPHNQQIEECNQTTELMFGYERKELIDQKTNFLHVNKKLYQQFKRNTKLQIENNGFFQTEFKMKRKNGDIFATEHFIRPLHKENDPLYKEVCVIRDITDRKQAEETLRNIVNGVASAGIGTTFLKSLLEHLAKSLQVKYAFIGQLQTDKPNKIKTLFLIADNQLADNIEYYVHHTPCEQVLKNKLLCTYPQQIQQSFPLDTISIKMGVESYSGTPLFNAKGNIVGLMSIMDDKPLTHQKQTESMLQIFAARASAELGRIQALEALHEERASLAMRVKERTAELTAANAELARVARLKDEFLACMSHELRTPLNSILGLSEMLQDGIYGTLNTKQNKSIRTIEESGRHLLSLINEILDLAKIDAGKLKLEIAPVSVDGISNASLRLIKESALKKRIKTSANYDSAVKIIQADERYLLQILLNLLSNAIKFTPEGGQVNLEVRAHAEQRTVNFIVSDTGIGIAEKDMVRLFKPFIQLDSGLNRAYEGTGLGLSLVSRLTELHGGSVSVKSEIGKGTHFIVSLPWQPITETLPTPDEPAPQADIPSSSAVILLVDDNLTTIETLSDYLEANGYQIIMAYDGTQAIEKTIEEHPDLILMDIQMPCMDGQEATRRIRAKAEVGATPIIALTALAMPGDRERCLEAGVNDYLSKPVNLKRLKAAIEGLVGDKSPTTNGED